MMLFKPSFIYAGVLSLLAATHTAALAADITAENRALARQLAISEVQALEGAGRFDETQVLVKFRPGASAAERERVIRSFGTGARRLGGQGKQVMATGEFYVVKLGRRWSVASVMSRIADDDSAVDYIVPDWILKLQAEPANDPDFAKVWGVQGRNTSPASPFGTGAAEMWAKGYVCKSAAPAYVAVLDTGVRTTHQDLRDQVFLNPNDAAVDQRDDDGNGLVDDVKGWNFYANNNNVEDDHSHGTHVAGTIAARRNNALGSVGMCGDGGVKIIPVKVCSSGGSCPTSAVLAAMNYVVDLKKNRGINVVAVNLSLGGLTSTPNLAGIEYFQAAQEAGIMVAAAAGNNGVNTDDRFMWPASLPVDNIISVANLKADGLLSTSSNHGTSSVDIAAPGSGIYSTVHGSDSAYNWKSGTSMAAPHVAGAIGLYRVQHPQAGVAETRNALLGTAAVESTLQGKVDGARRLDVSGWQWNTVSTSYVARCGLNASKTGFWFLVNAYTDDSRRTVLRYMGISYKAYDPTGKLLNTYIGRTNNNGAALWAFNRSAQPWGQQFTVQVQTDDGGSRTYSSSELNCPVP